MSKSLILKNFKNKININKKTRLLNYIKKINNSDNPKFFISFKKGYKYSFNQKLIKKYMKFKNIHIIGMGGSSLGTKAIYNFLNKKIKKKITFSENLSLKNQREKKSLNLIISNGKCAKESQSKMLFKKFGSKIVQIKKAE